MDRWFETPRTVIRTIQRLCKLEFRIQHASSYAPARSTPKSTSHAAAIARLEPPTPATLEIPRFSVVRRRSPPLRTDPGSRGDFRIRC